MNACLGCNEIRPHKAKGFCKPCYFSQYHLTHPLRRERNEAAKLRGRAYRQARANDPEFLRKKRGASLAYLRTPAGRYNSSKNTAKHKSITFSLSQEEYETARAHPCTYCGGELSQSGVGLDRLDSSGGYTIGNVAACCRNCNVIKSDLLTPDETMQLISVLKALRGKDLPWEK